MNVYQITVAYNDPIEARVNILARDQDHALERLDSAVHFKEMPEEMNFRVQSISLLKEDVPVTEDEIEEAYQGKDKHRILN